MLEKNLTAGVVGLGSMGLGIANSLGRMMTVKGYDLDDGARARFSDGGGHAAASVADAAKDADVLVVVVVNAAQAEKVLVGSGGSTGALSAMPKGGVVISSVTMAPEDSKRLMAHCAAAEIDFLDAPISGGSVKAAAGELTVLASGSSQAFAKAWPVLDGMATKVHRLGDEPGVGSAFKIINQLLAGVHIAAACEAIAFAKRLDLDIEKVFEVITGSAGNSWMFENRVPHILAGDYRPASAVDIFTKDLGIVSDLARTARFPTPLANNALQLFLMTSAMGMGRDDDASVVRLFARIAGLDLPESYGK